MEQEVSITRSQDSATDPFSLQDEFSQHPHVLFV